MSGALESSRRPLVFVSYAQEKDDELFTTRVAELVRFLEESGCEVESDHKYDPKPPSCGWDQWMFQSSDRADVVLLICTPRYRDCAEGRTVLDGGNGVKLEIGLLLQGICADGQVNDRVFPLVPDGGSEEDIPKQIRSWRNGHFFPSGRDRILELVHAAYAAQVTSDLADAERVEALAALEERSDDGETQDHFRSEQEELTISLLEECGVEFQAALESRIRRKFRIRQTESAPRGAVAVVDWLLKRPEEDMQGCLNSIRAALEETDENDPSREKAERAACALFFLIAMGNVDCHAYVEGRIGQGNSVSLPIEELSKTLCAVLAARMSDKEVSVGLNERGELSVRNVVRLSVAQDQRLTLSDLCLELHDELLALDRGQTTRSLMAGSGGDTLAGLVRSDPQAGFERKLDEIGSAINRQQEVKNRAVAVVVPNSASSVAIRDFAERFDASVFFAGNEEQVKLLGMPVGRFLTDTESFLRDLVRLARRNQTDPRSPAPQGE